jgi:hypothetical protein
MSPGKLLSHILPVSPPSPGQEKAMRFQITRASLGAVSKDAPVRGAIRGPESSAWPGEYSWFLDMNTLDELLAFLGDSGGALGMFSPEPDEECPVIEVFDEDEEDE